MNKKILLVEDRLDAIPFAMIALGEHLACNVLVAKDYDEAIEILEKYPEINFVVTDLFFPKKTGSNDISLGLDILNQAKEEWIKENDPSLGKLYHKLATFEKLEEELLITDEMLRKNFGKQGECSEDAKKRLFLTFKLREEILSSEGITVEHVPMIHLIQKIHEKMTEMKILHDKMGQDEHQQGLGVLVAQKAIEMGKKVLMVSSMYHHGRVYEAIAPLIYKNKIRNFEDIPLYVTFKEVAILQQTKNFLHEEESIANEEIYRLYEEKNIKGIVAYEETVSDIQKTQLIFWQKVAEKVSSILQE